MTPTTLCVYLFETTNDAMWAEDVALERGIPAEVAPAPPEANSKCGLSLRTKAEHRGEMEAALEAEGVPFRHYEG